MNVHNRNSSSLQEQNVLSRLWYMYFPHWPVFVLMILFFLGAAWVYIRYSQPLYEAKAVLLIKDPKKGEDYSKVVESLNQMTAKKIIENELEVIRSRALMAQVVMKLGLYASYYNKTSLLMRSVYHSPVKIIAKDPAQIKESIKPIPFTIDTASKKIYTVTNAYPLNEWVQTPYGVLMFSMTVYRPQNNTAYFFTIENTAKVTQRLVDRLEVEEVNKLSSVVRLSIKDAHGTRAEDILNELMDAYNRAAVNEENHLAKNTLDFVDGRLQSVAQQLEGIEKRLQDYKTQNGAVDISSQGTIYLQYISDASRRYADASTQLSVLEQLERYVQSKSGTGGIVPSTLGVSDPLLTDLLSKLYGYELQYERVKRTTAENNPVVLSLKDQIEKIKPGILENIQSQKYALQATVDQLYQTINRHTAVLHTIPQKEKDMLEITRNQAIINNLYNFLLQKKEEASLSLSSSIVNSRIIDKAQASFGPVSPNHQIIYLIACLSAFALPGIFIGMREAANGAVLFRHEIDSYTNVPVIAEIIHYPGKSHLVTGNGKRTFIAEQFRHLRASLSFLGIKGGQNTIMVTSAVSGDGKSFVLANLANTLALAGKKVLMIDFDLNQPTLSLKFGLTPTEGLSEYLKTDFWKDEYIQAIPSNNKLFLLSAGLSLPENPTELLLGNSVTSLLRDLKSKFDYLIIDTPPVGALTDAYLLSSFVDATLFVIRHQHTPKSFIRRFDEQQQINELKNIAFVFNGIKARGFHKTTAYGYGYGYGYIRDEQAIYGKRVLSV
ncbi:MAG: polysaccharide biosynthesis tyrosine autokinase [Bacteroidetes bacterium]|nr:polysaccharide biosynthesis tyrosine autokinase [Bacteroidota bacterium]